MEDFGYHVLALEPRRVGERHASPASHFGGQGDIIGPELPTWSVEEGHHADHLAVDGEGHRERRGVAGAVPVLDRRRDRCHLDLARAVGRSRRRLGVEGQNVRAHLKLRGPRFEDARSAHGEPQQATLAGHLDDTGIGQPFDHQVHRPLHQPGGVQTGAQ